MKMRPLLFVFASLLSFPAAVLAEPPPGRTVEMSTMTWFHPLLRPGLGEVTLVCTVVAVEPAEQVYGNRYWKVRLRIDERICIAEQFQQRFEGVQFIEGGDFRRRKVGEQVVYFGGIGEKYEGEDFLKPCWSGTPTDLGILLHRKKALDFADNERLLESLRQQAKGAALQADDYEAFAAFCPKGVAETLIRQLRRAEMAEEDAPVAPKPPSP